jgi:hypothetical protein
MPILDPAEKDELEALAHTYNRLQRAANVAFERYHARRFEIVKAAKGEYDELMNEIWATEKPFKKRFENLDLTKPS